MREKILLVEDKPTFLKAFNSILTNAGYDVTTATNGEEGLEYIKNAEFDLLLTDIRMPKMDGDILLSKSKKIRPGLMAIIITAYGNMDLAIKCLKENLAFDFLDKTGGEKELLPPIRKALKLKKSISRKNLELKRSISNANVLVQINEMRKDMKHSSAYAVSAIGALGLISLLLNYTNYKINLIHPSLSLIFVGVGFVSLISYYTRKLWCK